MYAGHLDFSFPLTRVVDGVLDDDERRAFIARIEDADDAHVPPVIGRVGTTDVGEVIDVARRNHTRVMFDDVDVAARLFARVRPHLPPSLFGRAIVGVNERIRLYRYAPGQRHAPHWDTPVLLDGRESALTLVAYLDDACEGGATSFPELGQAVRPRAGAALIFQQRVLHEAQPVTRGVKRVLRTEVMIAT